MAPLGACRSVAVPRDSNADNIDYVNPRINHVLDTHMVRIRITLRALPGIRSDKAFLPVAVDVRGDRPDDAALPGKSRESRSDLRTVSG